MSREMTGKFSVGLVVVESTISSSAKFSPFERLVAIAEVQSGLNWLVSLHPTSQLSWVFDVQQANIKVTDSIDLSQVSIPYDRYFLDPAMGKVKFEGNSYEATLDSVAKYRADMRKAHGTDDAIVIFLSPFGSSWHAYSHGEQFILLDRHGDWGGWGINGLNIIAAHETCHQFGAADEYAKACSSCDDSSGNDKVANGNCEDCAAPPQDCLMGHNAHRMCGFTRGQIGWSKLFVELWTGPVNGAGTDDDVVIDIGYQKFALDTSSWDDREMGYHEGYAIFAGGKLSLQDIKRILIRKSPDGDNGDGAWLLQRLRVSFDGKLLCDESPMAWLQDERRTFLATSFKPDPTDASATALANSIKLKVTTANVPGAGTDDDVSVDMAGHSWYLDTSKDDFESGNTDTFVLDPQVGMKVSDFKSIKLRKSFDGVSGTGAWRLGGLELIVNGTTIYKKSSINKLLKGSDLSFSDTIP